LYKAGQLPAAIAAALIWILLSIGASTPVSAQGAAPNEGGPGSASAPVVPQQVRYAGKLGTRGGDTVEAVFRIYAAAEGGDPLWSETQRVTTSEDGSYSVLLGSVSLSGLPQTVFAGGAARWLGVSVERGAEQERVLLSSVPYAMKSADAESLAGHAVSEFVTQEQLAQLAQLAQLSAQSGAAGSSAPAITPLASGALSGSGTDGTIPLWTGTLTQGNSEIVQVGSDIGINEAAPGATLDVGGTTMFRGTATLPAEATATASAGYRSQLLDFTDSAWSTTANEPVAQTWRLYAIDHANDTANPTSSLDFQFQNGAGAATPTVLSIEQTGVIDFAPTQTFPGTAQLGTSNTFASSASFADGVQGLTASGTGVSGTATGTGFAGYFLNNTTVSPSLYAENDASGNPGLGVAVKGYVSGASAIGVLGKSIGDSAYGVFGENVGGTDSWGVHGSATGPGSHGVYGVSTGPADENAVTGDGVVGVSTYGAGTHGISGAGSTTGAGYSESASGAWGDAGNADVPGVLGTNDNGYAGEFVSNGNASSVTFNSRNFGTGAAANIENESGSAITMEVSNNTPNSASAAFLLNFSNVNPTLSLKNGGTGGVEVSRAGLFTSLMATTPLGTCGIGGEGDLSCTGQVKALVTSKDGARKVETYATQSAENWMEDYGTGVMERGVSVVKIDPAFAETISESADYHVFITPRGDSKGLYVINATADRFEVRESGGGTSSLTFDYKIVARRRGYEGERLKDVTESFNAAKARADQTQQNKPKPLAQKKGRSVSSLAPGMSQATKAALEASESGPRPTQLRAPESRPGARNSANQTLIATHP